MPTPKGKSKCRVSHLLMAPQRDHVPPVLSRRSNTLYISETTLFWHNLRLRNTKTVDRIENWVNDVPTIRTNSPWTPSATATSQTSSSYGVFQPDTSTPSSFRSRSRAAHRKNAIVKPVVSA